MTISIYRQGQLITDNARLRRVSPRQVAALLRVATATTTGAGRSPAGRVLAALRASDCGLTAAQTATAAGLVTPLALDQLRRLRALRVVRQDAETGAWHALPASPAVK